MSTGDNAAALLRSPNGPQRATLLELFFDLVYVAALALASTNLAEHLSWTGAVGTLLPLMAIWWTWSITALLTDFYDPQRKPIQVTLVATMLGSILMAVALPGALGAHGLMLAGTYVTVHVGRGFVLVTALRGGNQPQRRAARFMIWFGVSGIAWIGGAFAHGAARGVLWVLALAVDYVSAGLRYPVPWLGRVPLEQYRKAGEHIGERYQQFMILSLGDLILVPTLRYSRTDFTSARTGAFLVAFATTVLLWQIYVYRAGSLLQSELHRNPGQTVRWAPYTHLLMTAGIVATAAGFELVIDRPTGVTPPAWVGLIFGGPMLFLIGRTTFEYQVFSRISWSRIAFLAVLAGVAPAMMDLSPLLVTICIGLILLGIAIADAIRTHRSARPPPRSETA
jgi:low temperature requirement protein LtrA